MLDLDQDQLVFLGMLLVAALSVSAFIYLLVGPYLTGERRQEKRLQNVVETTSRMPGRIAEITSNRKQQVADTLRDLEAKQQADKKVSLRQQLQRSGLDVDVKTFWMASAGVSVATMVLTFLMAPNVSPFIIVGIGIIGFFGLPRWILNKIVSRRQNAFLTEFANAIDIIVRGVKSGLPLNECLNIIARESADPIGSEFREVVEQQRVGVPLQECFERLTDRMPLPEVRFFAIVIAIQQSAGGNLSEALGNLSSVLRDRKAMQSKVKALSAEAKASAGVLAALPFVVMTLVYLSTPEYISLLWQKKAGNFMMVGGAFWMACGVLIMRKMINFKF